MGSGEDSGDGAPELGTVVAEGLADASARVAAGVGKGLAGTD
jgi:hypothetical protein